MRYTPRKYAVHTNIIPTPQAEVYPTLLPLLLISKGLPPPLPPSAFGVPLETGVELWAVAALVVETGMADGVVVLGSAVGVWDASAVDVVEDDSTSDVVKDAEDSIGGIGGAGSVDGIEGARLVEDATGLTIDNDIIVKEVEVVLGVGCTIIAGVVEDTCAGELVVVMTTIVDRLLVDSNMGQSAGTTPPFLTIPKSVLGLTTTVEQASCTAAWMVNRFVTQSFEHPPLKSFLSQLLICVSYVKRHAKGRTVDVISWKFDRENAKAVGSARMKVIGFRRIVDDAVHNVRKHFSKKTVMICLVTHNNCWRRI